MGDSTRRTGSPLDLTLQFIVQDLNEHEEDLFKQKWSGRVADPKIRQKLGWGTAVDAPTWAP